MGGYVLVIDQGTTGTRCYVMQLQAPGALRVLGRGYCALPQHYPQPGWVEHDLETIWAHVRLATCAAVAQARIAPSQLAAIGVTNQRETVGFWDASGKPLGPAIVWQDRRTAEVCAQLRQSGHAAMVQARTGLRLDPYFSATKLSWLKRHRPDVRQALAAGQARCGSVDTYLIYKLTGHKTYATDVTNASRTALYDLHSGVWDAELCQLFDAVPAHLLAEVHSCDAHFGLSHGLDFLPDGIPITGVAGDQQAALFGQACSRPGMAKCTLGTGAFALVHTGATAVAPHSGLLATVAWRLGAETSYALEGSVFVAGALVQWLRDGLQLFEQCADIEALAAQVGDTAGVSVVPALTGLGAPHWRPEARGIICGLSRGSTKAHIARAALEGIAWQVADLLAAMRQCSGAPICVLRADGGAAANDLLLQFLADFSGVPVHRAPSVELTAVGAGWLAALGAGLVSRVDALTAAAAPAAARVFAPSMPADVVQRRAAVWQAAVQKA